MDKINSYDTEQITLKIINSISQKLNLVSENMSSDLIINKGQYRLNAEKFHEILAFIADDTGISMITLRRVFPYDYFFITYKSGWLVIVGIVFLIVAMIVFFIDRNTETGISLFLLLLFFLIEFIALLNYIKTAFLRKIRPLLTVALFIKIMMLIIHKYQYPLTFGVQIQERQFWRSKIYGVLKQYLHIFFPAKEFSPELMMPFADPDEYDLCPAVEECGEIMALSLEVIEKSGIYKKYTSYDEDNVLTAVHFADLLIDLWAERKI